MGSRPAAPRVPSARRALSRARAVALFLLSAVPPAVSTEPGEPRVSGQTRQEVLLIIERLEDKENRHQWPRIARDLLLIQDPGVKPQLKRLVRHESAFVRHQASGAFSRLADSRDLQDVLEMSQNPDWSVRSSAVDAMKKIPSSETEEALARLLTGDPHRIVRANAARALGRLRGPRAVPFLQKALSDEEALVRREAADALRTITGRDLPRRAD